jgi:hypothetical protein
LSAVKIMPATPMPHAIYHRTFAHLGRFRMAKY